MHGVAAVTMGGAMVVGGVVNAGNALLDLGLLMRAGGSHGHHSFPKFLGGKANQPTTRMPQDVHENLHRDLNKFLRDRVDSRGNHMRPQRGNDGRRIQENFTESERLQAMADFYRQFTT